jgi:glyoxylase-like metal-dependent hydrolase (beta-lactamase superfamily II)
MIDIKTFRVNPLMVNCYVVSDDTKEACIIDPGCMAETEWTAIKNYIESCQLKLVHMLCTHLHFDHIMGCGFVYRDYQLSIEGSMADQQQYEQLRVYMNAFDLDPSCIPPQPPVHDITNQPSIQFGTHTLTILKTPGHTPGGLCFYCPDEDVLWAGDTLFQGSIGRTDLPGGNFEQIAASIRDVLFTLPPTTQVFTGHGPSTTIEYEQKYNPYI